MRALLPGFIAVWLTIPFSQAQAAPASWAIVHEASRLGFVATEDGDDFEGEFKAFEAEMLFSEDALGESRFDVGIDVTSIDAGNTIRNEMLPDEEWFFFERFPRASYVTSEIRQGDDTLFEAVGTLSLRGVERQVILPFRWRTNGDRAHMQGRVTLDRTHFNIGQGEWADDDPVGYGVEVVVDLTLKRDE